MLVSIEIVIIEVNTSFKDNLKRWIERENKASLENDECRHFY